MSGQNKIKAVAEEPERHLDDKTLHRLKFIDISKAIGLVFVMLSHICSVLAERATPFFITIFFVVSGYCTIREVKISKKFKKLIIPYIIFTIILFALNGTHESIDFIGALYSRWCLYQIFIEDNILFLRSNNGPLWFLTSMFVAFLLFKIIEKCQKETYKLMVVAIYIIISYLMTYLPVLLPWSIDTAFLMATFIYLGVKVRELELMKKINIWWCVILCALYVIFYHCCAPVNISVRVYGNHIFLFIPASVVGCLVVMKLSQYLERYAVGNILSRIGQCSLTIFCLHMPFIGYWNKILSTLVIDMHPYVNAVLCLVFLMVCLYPLSLLFDKYILNKLT